MKLYDADGIGGPFEHGIKRAVREDAKAARRLRKPVLRKPARLNLFLEDALRRRLESYAAGNGLDMSKAARVALAAGLEALTASTKETP